MGRPISSWQASPALFILQATPFLEMLGHVQVARLLLHQAVIAYHALEERYPDALSREGEERARYLEEEEGARFYDGKVQGARFFASQILPRAGMIARTIKQADPSALEVVL